jgi:ATP-dependent Clp protease ATP-binding subunit ClpB
MSALSTPKLGFERSWRTEKPDEKLDSKLSRTGMAAARGKFTPEFINRIDKIVVFKPLGETDRRRILDLELNQVQRRILASPSGKRFALTVSETAKRFLLQEGTDIQYGARHLKRTIERLVVHPLSNLIATDRVNTGDWIEADFDDMHNCLLFRASTENLTPQAVSRLTPEESCTWAAAA